MHIAAVFMCPCGDRKRSTYWLLLALLLCMLYPIPETDDCLCIQPHDYNGNMSTQSSFVSQDVFLVTTSGSTSYTSFVRQHALDFKGMITLSQVFRPRCANLIAQEGAYPCSFIQTGIVFMYVGSYSRVKGSHVSVPLNLLKYFDVLSEDKFCVWWARFFWFYFLLRLWKNGWNRMPFYTWNIRKYFGRFRMFYFPSLQTKSRQLNRHTWLTKTDLVKAISWKHLSYLQY